MSRANEAIAALLARPPLPLIATAAAAHDGPVLLVGGAVRDTLLGRPPADLDIVVGGDLGGFLEGFAAACGRRPVDIHDGWRNTHRTVCGGVHVDVARMLGGSIEEDLAERDFTINAMAVELGGSAAPLRGVGAGRGEDAAGTGGAGGSEGLSLIDPYGGHRDLDAGCIRMSGFQALEKDPLRMLRALRYQATLGGFVIEAGTAAAITKRAASIEEVAAERIQNEWGLLLAGEGWAGAVETAWELGLGARTLVAVRNLDGVAAWAAHEAAGEGSPGEERLMLRLAAVLSGAIRAAAADGLKVDHDDGERLRRELVRRRWPSEVARLASRVAACAVELGSVSDEDLVERALQDHVAAARAVRLARALAAHRGRPEPPACERLELWSRRAAEAPWVSGVDLRRWGMPEGPEIGVLLACIARGQVERRWDSAEGARAWARGQVGDAAGSSGAGA